MSAKAKKLDKLGPGKTGQELGALADEAKGAAERAGAAIDDALAFVAESDARISRLEVQAKKAAG